MRRKKHKLPVVIGLLSIVALMGFKDTGIFVKDYIGHKDDGIMVEFKKEDEIQVLRETDSQFLIQKKGINYEIPKENLIRTTRSSQSYKVINRTVLLDKPEGSPIRILLEDSILQLEKIEGEYGAFRSTDDMQGYVNLKDVEPIKAPSLSYGISKVDKVIKENDLYYTLIKGETVAIKGFKDNSYIIVDEKDNEFKIKENYIDFKNIKPTASRSSLSRRTKAVTTVVTAAHKALGKPYVYGDTGARGYDCSGLTYSLYLNNLSVKLLRSSASQVKNGEYVAKADIAPGDLLFFNTSGKGISHVGLYIGDRNMIHASTSNRKVMITSIDSTYYRTRYVTARRIIK